MCFFGFNGLTPSSFSQHNVQSTIHSVRMHTFDGEVVIFTDNTFSKSPAVFRTGTGTIFAVWVCFGHCLGVRVRPRTRSPAVKLHHRFHIDCLNFCILRQLLSYLKQANQMDDDSSSSQYYTVGKSL